MDVLWKDTNIFYNVLCFLITENEKFFDRSDARLYWRTVTHMFGILHHFYVAVFALSLDLVSNQHEEIRKLYTFRSAYLTGWNFSFQTVFLFLSLIYDICEWLSIQEAPRAKKIAYWRDIIFTSLVVPYTLFVSLMFWSVYWIDRELVFPKVYDSIVPWWFNHCVHTNISIVVLIETILQARRKPVNLKVELIITSIVAVAYAIVYYSIFFFANRWLYNVFGVMTWWQVCLYQILIWASSYVFYFMQFPINRLIHGSEPELEKTVIERIETKDVPKTVEQAKVTDSLVMEKNGLVKNFEIASMEKKQDVTDAPFSSENWSLKYRSLRDKFENSRL